MQKLKLSIVLLLVLMLFISGDLLGQKAAVKIESMSIHQLHELGLPNPNSWDNVSTGLSTVGIGTMVYMTGWDTAGNTAYNPALSYTWSLTSKPTGSLTVIESPTTQLTYFKPDMAGTYTVQLSITTAAGSHSTTQNIKAATYTGTNWKNVAGAPFNCASCHESATAAIYTEWKASDHATMFEGGMNALKGAHWGENCFKCHTTGYNKNAAAVNGGFDDVATTLGFVWTQWSPPRTGLFDSLLTTDKKMLSLLGGITCENCHGPKDPTHYTVGTQPKTMSSGICAQCHDEPWRHNRYAQWENSGHSEAVWSSSFVRNFGGYTLGMCYRCHDGQAFVNFTKGKDFASSAAQGYGPLKHTKITCQTCHDPHSMHLRTAPTGSDTLANAYNYSSINFGYGKICVNCHKYRQNEATYVNTRVSSSHWGPHYAGAADVFLGKNGHTFGTVIQSSVAHRLIENACVGCHMSATPDTGTVARDKIGQHSWNMRYIPVTGPEVHNVTGCVSCHAGITNFEDILASFDYDADGTVEPFITEVEGLKKKLVKALAPVGVDSVDWMAVRDHPDSINMRKAFWNYKYVSYDGSHGVHNPKYVVGLLQKSITTITGIEFSTPDVPTTYELAQNYPNPFNPSTRIKYQVPISGQVTIIIYNSLGQEIIQLVNDSHEPGSYFVDWNGKDKTGKSVSSGIYFYQMNSNNFSSMKKMLLVK